MNSASGFSYNIRLTISPFITVNITFKRKITDHALLTAIGLTSKFFFPTKPSRPEMTYTIFFRFSERFKGNGHGWSFHNGCQGSLWFIVSFSFS